MTDISWHIETRKIKDLKDYEKNPRILTQDQERHLSQSLLKFGLIDKPIINIDNTIIGGHQRKRTLKKMGIKEIQVNVPSRLLTIEEVEELNIRLNKNTGEWDYDVLVNQWEIDNLIEWGFVPEELLGASLDKNAENDSNNIQEEKCESCGKKLNKKT